MPHGPLTRPIDGVTEANAASIEPIYEALEDTYTTAEVDTALLHIGKGEGLRTMEIGDGAATSGSFSTAIGSYAEAGDNALAVGPGAKALATKTTAVGSGAYAGEAAGVTAIGTGAYIESTAGDATAIGRDTYIEGARAIAIGAGTESAAGDATALGSGASAEHARSVALGSDAATTADDQVMVGARDIEITDAARGVILPSPDGTRYRLTVANDGTIGTAIVP